MADTRETAMFESEEFEVVDEIVDEDEPLVAEEYPKPSQTDSRNEKKTLVETPKEEKTKDTKTGSKQKVESVKTVEKDKEMKPKEFKNAPKKEGQKQQSSRTQKSIDFSDDIAIEHLDAHGEYMTDEEIMNHLDEIENIVLDGTGFELQDDADQSNATLNTSEIEVQDKKSGGEPAAGPEAKSGNEGKPENEDKKGKESTDAAAEKKEGKKSEPMKTEVDMSDEDWYEKKLETKVGTVKDRLSKLARVLELTYPRYKGWLDRNEAYTGTPICRLEPPRRCPLEKPHTNRWKFVCNRKPVQESQESTEKQNENKEESSGNTESTMWRLTPTGVWDSNTDNSSEYPPFVMKAVKVFEDFLQTTPSVDESLSQPAAESTTEPSEAPKAEESTARSDTDDKENAKQQWLWLLVRCNRIDELMLFATGKNIDRTTMDSLKQVYEVGPGKDCKVKSLYCKSITKAATTTTFLVGSEALDEIVGGIKIQLAPKTNFWSNAAGAESLGNAVADLLLPTPKTTVVEIGCGTGLIGLMLASKCHQVIGLDSPSEVEEAEMTSELNGVKNASFVTGEPSAVMSRISKVLSNCKAAAIVNTNTNIGRAIEVMTDLRKITSLKRLVMVTTLTKQSVRSILELTRPGDHLLGNPFIPIRACVVDTLPIGPHFEVVILMERRIINKFPRRWVNPSHVPAMTSSTVAVDKEKGAASTQSASVPPKKEKVTLNRTVKTVEPPVKKIVDKAEPVYKKPKFAPGPPKKPPFVASKQHKNLPPLPPPKPKFKTKRFHSPERPHVPPKKFAPRFDKGNVKPWAVPRTSAEHKFHEDRRGVRHDEPVRRNPPFRHRSPVAMKNEIERRKPRSWSEESVMQRGSPGRDKRFRDHKDQSDLRERLSSNRIEPEIMEKVKKQQQMLNMAQQKLSGPSPTVDVSTAKELQNMLSMVLEHTSKLQSQLPRSVWDRIAPPENLPSSSNMLPQNDPLLKGRYVQEMGTQDILITTANREFMKPNEPPRGNFDRFNAMPSNSRQESGRDRFQNIPDRYHGHGGDYHKQQEQGNQWNRNKQSEKNRWEPFSQGKKGSPPVRKPMSPPRHHMAPMGRPASPRRGNSSPRRPLSPPRRPISPQRRHMSPPRRQILSPRRQMSPSRHQGAPRHQMSPARRQHSPPRRAMSPPRHQISPSRRHISPARRQISPPRRMDDEWDIPSRGAVEQNTWQRPNERIPEKRWHEDRQPPNPSSWDHSANNDRFRKSVNQDKWDIKDASHEAIWTNTGGGGDSWDNKQQIITPNKEHWQSGPDNRWPNSSGGSNGDNWNIGGKESFAKPSGREESKPVWADQGNKQRWGDSGGSAKDTWGQADKEDWNDLPDDAKDPWGDDGNNQAKERWPKYDNNPGPSSGWARENQAGDNWGKPNDNWQNKSASNNKNQWKSSGPGQMNNESRWGGNEGPKKGSMSGGGGWQGNVGTNSNWQTQNYPGFQQSRSYNPGPFKDRR